jgi:membrane protein YqaA with SNARE-associated domain
MDLTPFLILFAIVFAINLMPAFGPPTWSVIVLYGLNSELPLGWMVLTAALASSSGRYLLAHGFRLFAGKLSAKTRGNLAAAREAFQRKRHHNLMALVFFVVSPLPSAQQFGAVGLAEVHILPFTLAFFVGRLLSYAFYAGGAALVEQQTSLGETFRANLTSPWFIAVQVILLGALVALAKVNWAKVLGRRDA